jgi:DNA integrity scanning protein DisA with diadenylate cyclase activity
MPAALSAAEIPRYCECISSLGSRHMAAAGITHETEAIAVVVSQTSGAVRVFRHGRAVLELSSRIRRS